MCSFPVSNHLGLESLIPETFTRITSPRFALSNPLLFGIPLATSPSRLEIRRRAIFQDARGSIRTEGHEVRLPSLTASSRIAGHFLFPQGVPETPRRCMHCHPVHVPSTPNNYVHHPMQYYTPSHCPEPRNGVYTPHRGNSYHGGELRSCFN